VVNLIVLCHAHMRENGIGGTFATEPDIIIDDARVARPDAALMTTEDKRLQRQAAAVAGGRDPRRTRILVPPTLIVESVSPGHEHHDRKTKFRWYAEFGVPNYWILDAFQHSLTCWVLDGAAYRQDAAGRNTDEIRPGLFPGLVISLASIWG
jgi:Uma2 family endonuclease